MSNIAVAMDSALPGEREHDAGERDGGQAESVQSNRQVDVEIRELRAAACEPSGASPSSASATSTALPKTNAIARMPPTTRGSGPPWMPVRCTAAWPLPRPISQRLTGTAATNASERANAN